jgi:hypothetical protein
LEFPQREREYSQAKKYKYQQHCRQQQVPKAEAIGTVREDMYRKKFEEELW